ncbi:hypothetical protein J7E49_21795 [Variovorax paradoxus]|nr:hypothetical protein [Variovorax paradoxus]
MSDDILIGNHVRLISLPEWLTHDLPIDEQVEMRTFIGQIAIVREIDSHGYIWIGFGTTSEDSDDARYSGHSFGVPLECIELIAKTQSN